MVPDRRLSRSALRLSLRACHSASANERYRCNGKLGADHVKLSCDERGSAGKLMTLAASTLVEIVTFLAAYTTVQARTLTTLTTTKAASNHQECRFRD
jgi:hypothetical protein